MRGFMLLELLMVILIIGVFHAGTDLTDPKNLLLMGGALVGGTLVVVLVVPRIADMVVRTRPVKDKTSRHVSLARAYERQQDYTTAVKEYETAIKKGKKNVDLYLELSEFYYRLGKYDRAIEVCRRILKANKKMNLGQKFYLVSRMVDIYVQKKKDRGSAIALLEAIAQNHPESKYAAIASERIAKLRGTSGSTA